MAFINLLINKLNHNVYVNVKNNIFVTLLLLYGLSLYYG